ncbi:YbaK/EbsC family protein [Phyllobacterium pellucidum]|uniref:YbaK/EbsC family protein n=1 Tax=Phyllobacterium pellucidum TaxID=2740464 RepID=UPI001D15AC5B|nr:YbaK/EbsC family protein [Phyllobacterium sp. T1018]UGY08527.1 YbaK/EbsC family protein [Phyllobacterium sp. T1018]
MSKSVERVRQAAHAAGFDIEIREMPDSTHTAEDAAVQCGVTVGQIVKSLIFQGADTAKLYLFLVSGPRQLDLGKAARLTGEALHRADPKHVRKETGFAIGGVAPIGHLIDIAAYADEHLMQYDVVWAAAGGTNFVFPSDPKALVRAAKAQIADIAS